MLLAASGAVYWLFMQYCLGDGHGAPAREGCPNPQMTGWAPAGVARGAVLGAEHRLDLRRYVMEARMLERHHLPAFAT
jgi:hypothetical protein